MDIYPFSRGKIPSHQQTPSRYRHLTYIYPPSSFTMSLSETTDKGQESEIFCPG